ncbi:MAG: hypothetical protein WCH62_00185 [Candidatus Omnitrophota bacterium]
MEKNKNNKNNKRGLLIILWWVAAAVLVAGGIWLWFYFSQTGTYHDNQFHFSMTYPSAWEKKEGWQGTVVTFVRPKQTAMDLFEPNVNITVQEIPAKIATLESLSQTITKQMTAVFKNNITILEDKSFSFASREGHRLIIEAPQPNSLKAVFVWTIKGSMAYIFTFMCRTDQYEEYIHVAEPMIKSFEFK